MTARTKIKEGEWKLQTLEVAAIKFRTGADAIISLRVFSSKNSLKTCTRYLTSTKEDEDCPVRNILALYESASLLQGGPPEEDAAIFQLKGGKVLSRPQISKILKQAAATAKVPAARVASHSLRRGGASAYLAGGASDEAIQRFGRWTSDAYKAYVYPHAEEMHAALKKAIRATPHFERN